MQLVRYDAARQALAEAYRVDEVKTIRDKAAAMAAYARQSRDTDLIQWATEIKVRAERRCGELLRETAKTGDRATANGNVNPATVKVSHAATPTLSDLGITRSQSSRYQALAAMPEEHFETAVATVKEMAGEVTTAHMLRVAEALKKHSDKQARADAMVDIIPTPTRSPAVWSDIGARLQSAVDLIEAGGRLPPAPAGLAKNMFKRAAVIAAFVETHFGAYR